MSDALKHEQRREANAQKLYNRRAEKHKSADKMEKVAIGKPLEGPFYFLYLKPNWVLKSFAAETFMGHPDFWEALVDSTIAPHYKITDPRRIAAIKNIPYSMPRGRISDYQRPGRPMEWIGQIGNDFPWDQSLRKKIVAEFNLSQQYLAGLVRFVPDYHEVMIPDDHRQFEELVMPLPAKEKSRITIPDPEASGGIWDDED